MNKLQLMLDGGEVLRIENNNYYVLNEEFGVMEIVNRGQFIEALKEYSWVCLTSWDVNVKYEYLKIVDYIK